LEQPRRESPTMAARVSAVNLSRRPAVIFQPSQ
jgi:hypothetical protein